MIVTYKQIPVEVLDITEDGAGIRWAVIKAITGRPFVGGNKWPTRTAYATAKVDDLTFDDCGCVLPEHSCSVCRATARKVYGDGDEIPF